MKTLVCFYSLEGNCRELARVMAEAAGADVMEIIPREPPIPDHGFLRYFKGGKESIMKELPPLLPPDKNPRDYDLVIVGGPVWAWNIAPPARSFLAGTDWSGKKVALFCMHRGGKGFALGNMRELVEKGGGAVVGAADFRDLRRGNADGTRRNAAEWTKKIAAGTGAVTGEG